MGALCHQPFGLGRQLSGCFVRLLDLGSTKALLAFLASLGWRPSAAPTHYLGTLLGSSQSQRVEHYRERTEPHGRTGEHGTAHLV